VVRTTKRHCWKNRSRPRQSTVCSRPTANERACIFDHTCFVMPISIGIPVGDLLAAGFELVSAAERLRMSSTTARFHLKSIFRKTGLNRQVDLVRLLLSLPGDCGAARGRILRTEVRPMLRRRAISDLFGIVSAELFPDPLHALAVGSTFAQRRSGRQAADQLRQGRSSGQVPAWDGRCHSPGPVRNPLE